jgi:hypothetical protein
MFSIPVERPGTSGVLPERCSKFTTGLDEPTNVSCRSALQFSAQAEDCRYVLADLVIVAADSLHDSMGPEFEESICFYSSRLETTMQVPSSIHA